MRQRSTSERGQAFALMVISLVALLGTAAIVMDVGFAWYAKRQVQAQADAAALAGAQELPDKTAAMAKALEYANSNMPANLTSEATPVVTMGCSATTTLWCHPGGTVTANTIQVKLAAKTPTWFAKLLGLNNFDVSGTATACQPCSSSPVDIEVVLDRTGSMCDGSGSSKVCGDLNNAKEGIRTLLGMMDPSIDMIGLVAFPPVVNSGTSPACATAATDMPPDISPLSITTTTPAATTSVAPSFYDHSNLLYRDDALGDDYRASATAPALNESSSIVSHLVYDDVSTGHHCIAAFGYTSYADALQAGKDELDQNGRAGVPKVIVFMTDGEANIGSYQAGVTGHGYDPALGDPAGNQNMPASSGGASTINPGDAQPCRTAIDVASQIKAAGVTIYTIGYGLATSTKCIHGIWGQVDASSASSATDTGNFKCVKIGTAMSGPNATRSWALHPLGTYPAPNNSTYIPAAGHWVGSSGSGNPCTKQTHYEVPNITSYYTLSQIASVPSSNFFKNQASPGDVTALFAEIGADISKGTSRLVADSYLP
jgi:Flp pilus assembly protein TadG